MWKTFLSFPSSYFHSIYTSSFVSPSVTEAVYHLTGLQSEKRQTLVDEFERQHSEDVLTDDN